MKKIYLALLFFINALFADIGSVTMLEGEVFVKRANKIYSLNLGTKIEKNDIIETTSNSKAKITFIDNTVITIGKNSRLDIKDYNFIADKPALAKSEFSITKGAFHAITGKIGKVNPSKFKIKTKNATIGIRGTEIYGNQDKIICTQGMIFVESALGDIKNIANGNFVTTLNGKPLGEVTKVNSSDLDTIQKSFDIKTTNEVSVTKTNDTTPKPKSSSQSSQTKQETPNNQAASVANSQTMASNKSEISTITTSVDSLDNWGYWNDEIKKQELEIAEKERIQKEQEERLKREKEAEEEFKRKQKEEEERLKQEQALREKELKERQERERQEEARRLEAERLEAERLEAERIAAENAKIEAQKEAERKRLEAERLEAEKLKAQREAEEARRRQEEAERLKAQKEAEEAEALKRQKEAEEARLKAQQEAERQEALKREQEAEAARLKAQREKEAAEALRKQQEAEAARLREEEAKRLKAQQEAEAERLRAEQEAEAARRRQEEAERLKAQQEADIQEAIRKIQEAEAARQREQEEERRRQQEAQEALRKQQEDEKFEALKKQQAITIMQSLNKSDSIDILKEFRRSSRPIELNYSGQLSGVRLLNGWQEISNPSENVINFKFLFGSNTGNNFTGNYKYVVQANNKTYNYGGNFGGHARGVGDKKTLFAFEKDRTDKTRNGQPVISGSGTFYAPEKRRTYLEDVRGGRDERRDDHRDVWIFDKDGQNKANINFKAKLKGGEYK